MDKISNMVWTLLLLAATSLFAEDYFAGAMGGIGTIQADGTTQGSPPVRTSGYKPENGPTAMIFGGHHFTDFFSMQGGYSWNRHSVVLSGTDVGTSSSFELPMRATLHTFGIEAMAYFRDRESALRPYLSAGPTVLRFDAGSTGPLLRIGNPAVPSPRFDSTHVGLRVAVGMDWRIAEWASLRYSFSETIQANPIGRVLEPRGKRGFANFQNLWGVVFHF